MLLDASGFIMCVPSSEGVRSLLDEMEGVLDYPLRDENSLKGLVKLNTNGQVVVHFLDMGDVDSFGSEEGEINLPVEYDGIFVFEPMSDEGIDWCVDFFDEMQGYTHGQSASQYHDYWFEMISDAENSMWE